MLFGTYVTLKHVFGSLDVKVKAERKAGAGDSTSPGGHEPWNMKGKAKQHDADWQWQAQ